jgi:hypothetical protein
MDITPQTKQLIEQIQPLKARYTDPASLLFIDFYCQCKEGCDYLFPVAVRDTVRLIDILQWFLACAHQGQPTALVQLMWNDVVGPTLGEYLADEKIERRLTAAFQSDLNEILSHWDRVMLPSGNINLVLRQLLDEVAQIEQAQ